MGKSQGPGPSDVWHDGSGVDVYQPSEGTCGLQDLPWQSLSCAASGSPAAPGAKMVHLWFSREREDDVAA